MRGYCFMTSNRSEDFSCSTSVSAVAKTDALRGPPTRRDISPKNSPSPSSSRTTSRPSISLTTLPLPRLIKYIALPSSPSAIMRSPDMNCSGSSLSTIAPNSSLLKAANSGLMSFFSSSCSVPIISISSSKAGSGSSSRGGTTSTGGGRGAASGSSSAGGTTSTGGGRGATSGSSSAGGATSTGGGRGATAGPVVGLDRTGLVSGLDVIVTHAEIVIRVRRLEFDQLLQAHDSLGPLTLFDEFGEIGAEMFFLAGHGSLPMPRSDHPHCLCTLLQNKLKMNAGDDDGVTVMQLLLPLDCLCIHCDLLGPVRQADEIRRASTADERRILRSEPTSELDRRGVFRADHGQPARQFVLLPV